MLLLFLVWMRKYMGKKLIWNESYGSLLCSMNSGIHFCFRVFKKKIYIYLYIYIHTVYIFYSWWPWFLCWKHISNDLPFSSTEEKIYNIMIWNYMYCFWPNFTFNIMQFAKSAIFPFLSTNDDLAPLPTSPFKAHDVYNELLILFFVTVDCICTQSTERISYAEEKWASAWGNALPVKCPVPLLVWYCPARKPQLFHLHHPAEKINLEQDFSTSFTSQSKSWSSTKITSMENPVDFNLWTVTKTA